MSQSGLGVALIVARPIGSRASLVVALMTLCICTASLALAEDVLYCVDTDLTGFKWDNKGSVRTANFVAQRYTVKVVSDTERLITRMLGDTAGSTDRYHCEQPDAVDREIIACRGIWSFDRPWFFIGTRTRVHFYSDLALLVLCADEAVLAATAAFRDALEMEDRIVRIEDELHQQIAASRAALKRAREVLARLRGPVQEDRLDPGVAIIQKPITQEGLAARICQRGFGARARSASFSWRARRPDRVPFAAPHSVANGTK